MPETLSGKDIRQMNFNGRYLGCANGIVNGYGRMGIGGGIDNQPLSDVSGFLDPVDKLPFEVGLMELYVEGQVLGCLAAQSLDICKSGPAVMVRLRAAETVQVRPVQDVDG